MKHVAHYRRFLGGFLGLLVVIFTLKAAAKPGEILMGKKEVTFRVLQTKTGAYTNVTVTKKTKDWIFIIHSAGVCNVKATDLLTDARVALGYEAPMTNPAATQGDKIDARATPDSPALVNAPPTHQSLSHLLHFNVADVKKFAADWRHNGKDKAEELHSYFVANPMVVSVILGVSAVVYVCLSVCFWLICRKTHIAPGPLVWVPFLQLIPLLRAANMPRLWFFAYFIPIINIIPIIIIAIKIVKSRGKSPWVAFLLLMPLTTPFAFLYLAFSPSAPVNIATHEVMSLETA